jgi:uncharacterized protein (DUF427 family)
MKASWNGQVLAESDDTVVVEGNHYFPLGSIRQEFFKPSDKSTHCPWKGDASYYSIVVDGVENTDAAWYYPTPKAKASEIQGRVAFYSSVEIA